MEPQAELPALPTDQVLPVRQTALTEWELLTELVPPMEPELLTEAQEQPEAQATPATMVLPTALAQQERQGPQDQPERQGLQDPQVLPEQPCNLRKNKTRKLLRGLFLFSGWYKI